MAIEVKHAFVSTKGDGTDATLVRPSNWNESHKIEMATSKVIGRMTAGPGAAEELPVTSYMMGLLNTADFAALAVLLGLPTTGDAKLTYKAVVDAGWIFANDGTIGDVGSGASYVLPTYNTAALFTLFYNQFSDAVCPLQNSAGVTTTRVAQGTATNAFTAKCRMVIPKVLGRALIVAGTGTGLTNRVLGTNGGEENHTLLLTETPSHNHTGTPAGTLSDTSLAHTHTQTGTFTSGNPSANHTHPQQGTHTTSTNGHHDHGYDKASSDGGFQKSGGAGTSPYYQHTGATTGGAGNHTHTVTLTGETGTVSQWHTHDTTISGQTGSGLGSHKHTFTGDVMTTSSQGGGAAHNIMQPWTAWNVMIKL